MGRSIFHILNEKNTVPMSILRTVAGIFTMSFLFSSCALFKPMPGSKKAASESPYFDNISLVLNPGKKSQYIAEASIKFIEDAPSNNYLNDLQGIEYIPNYFFRYSVLLDVEVEKLTNKKLVDYVHQWYSVPYRIGGTSKEGIDCSAFVQGIVGDAFGVQLPRTAREQALYCTEIEKKDLQEGDLVFFNTTGGISHVGLYINNNKFVHASTSMGVVISDLDEPYWQRRFVKAGRMKSAE
jgi:NlpC/P60 family